MTETIKPIQTRYKGYNFRSRTEARWAVFFDALNVKFQYEPEGFELKNRVWYLPDFYVDNFFGTGGYFEVKPASEPSQEDLDKLELLYEATDSYVFLLNGPPDFKYYRAFTDKHRWGAEEAIWASVLLCASEAIGFDHRYEDLLPAGKEHIPERGIKTTFAKCYIAAVNASRAARF